MPSVRVGSGPNGPVIQRAAPPEFTNLGRLQAGTPIHQGADGLLERPKWLRGELHGAHTMRLILASARTPDFTYEGQAFYRCGLCGKFGDLNGMHVDHRINWRDYVEGAADQQEFEERYHDLDNLHLVHSNCNSSKGSEDAFEWWRGSRSDPYVDPLVLSRVRAALDRIWELTGIDWLFEIPESRRKTALDLVIEQALGEGKTNKLNANKHLMANAKLLTAVGGWELAGLKGNNDDMDQDDGTMT